MSRTITEVEVGERIEAMRRRRPRFTDERITTAHGAGGKASRALVEGVILPLLAEGGTPDPELERLGDAALLTVGGVRLALTTDAFVVRPIRFPGGSIGELAVNGTVNDLAVSGARPVSMSVALILEEGLPADVLRAEVAAMAAAARAAGVRISAGDTKVVERGKCDSMYVVTTGVGVLEHSRREEVLDYMYENYAREHAAITAVTQCFHAPTRPLWSLATALIDTCGADLHCMRDATRGGVATVLNEVALAAEVGVVIAEDRLPLRPPGPPRRSRHRAAAQRGARGGQLRGRRRWRAPDKRAVRRRTAIRGSRGNRASRSRTTTAHRRRGACRRSPARTSRVDSRASSAR